MTGTDEIPGTTVVVTSHNYADFLPACLASLQRQTRLPDELIVIDDGSQDDTQQVLATLLPGLRATFPVRLVHHEQPHGLAASLNEGFRLARTDRVVHVDADDEVLPRYLEAMNAALDLHPEAAYAYPRMRLTGTESGLYRTHPFDPGRLLFEGNYIPNVALLRRQAFLQTRGFRNLPTHVDWDLWLALLGKGHTGVLVDEVLYLWLRHGSSMTHQSRRTRLKVRAGILWEHRATALRHAAAAPRWTFSAVRRRVARTPGESRTASGWVER